MKVELELAPETFDELVEVVRAQVVAVIAAQRTPASPYLTVPEAATLMRCSRGRIDDLLSQRRLTRVKDGRRTLVTRAEIESYLSNGTSRRKR